MRIFITLVLTICVCLFALYWWLTVGLFKTSIPVAILLSVLILASQILVAWIIAGGFTE